MKRVTFIIFLTIIIVALVAIIVFSVNPQSQAPRTNSTQPQQMNGTTSPILIISEQFEKKETINEKLQ